MELIVLNGSPKGKDSITLQTVLYLEKLYPQHKFTYCDLNKCIRHPEVLTDTAQKMQNADLVLFSYPVYTFIAPYAVHRFIELLKQSGVCLEGKFVSQITTSKHFYDVTAHRYVQDNCHDMGMKPIRGLSADMDDLTTKKGRAEARGFMEYAEWCVGNDVYEKSLYVPREYEKKPVTPLEIKNGKTGDVVLVTNCGDGDDRLKSMIDRFCGAMTRKVRVVNIEKFPFKGGCLGCFNCAVSGECIYKDGFDSFLRNEIQTAQAIVTAFTIKDHSMGASFKLYDDRQFCNGHRTVTMGMPMGYIVCGDYASEYNLQTVLEARAQVGGNFLAGVATDMTDPDGDIDRLAKSLEYALDKKYTPPQNFYGVGGMKIFRDLIWLMQGMMKADHKFYKKHGQYDFPQRKRGTMLKMYLVGMMLSNKTIMKKAGGKMTEGMLMPYKKVLDNVKDGKDLN